MTEPLHRQDFPVHSYDVDTEGFLAPRALFAFLQEAAGGDAARGGYTIDRVAVGTSRWAVVDVAARRLVRLPEFVRRSPVPDRPLALDREPSALEPADPAGLERRFEVRRGDLDMVRHVNHTRYVEWALETVPDEVQEGCRPSVFEIAFRREAVYGDAVVARTRRLADGSDPSFAHELRAVGAGHELARAASVWRAHR